MIGGKDRTEKGDPEVADLWGKLDIAMALSSVTLGKAFSASVSYSAKWVQAFFCQDCGQDLHTLQSDRPQGQGRLQCQQHLS